MDYAQYVEMAQQGAQFVEAGDFDQALTRFRTLLASDISDLDKSRMCYNIAVVYEKMDNEREALFEYVYLPRTQLNHEEFPLAWDAPERHRADLQRAIFIASRERLGNEILTPSLMRRQTRHA